MRTHVVAKVQAVPSARLVQVLLILGDDRFEFLQLVLESAKRCQSITSITEIHTTI